MTIYFQRQVFWIIERLPSESRLKLDKTFDAQRRLVNNTIIPAVMEALDSDMFPVAEAIIYDMIHNRHKHQREEYLKKQQSSTFQDKEARRKHLNSRRNDVSNERNHFSFILY